MPGNPDRVSKRTRDKVLKVAAELGYIKNFLASGLVSSKTMVVGAIVPTVAIPTHSEALEALSEILVPQGYQILLGISSHSVETETQLVRTFLHPSRRRDRDAWKNPQRGNRLAARCGRLPVVETFEYDPESPNLNVGFSNFEAGHALTTFLIAKDAAIWRSSIT